VHSLQINWWVCACSYVHIYTRAHTQICNTDEHVQYMRMLWVQNNWWKANCFLQVALQHIINDTNTCVTIHIYVYIHTHILIHTHISFWCIFAHSCHYCGGGHSVWKGSESSGAKDCQTKWTLCYVWLQSALRLLLHSGIMRIYDVFVLQMRENGIFITKYYKYTINAWCTVTNACCMFTCENIIFKWICFVCIILLMCQYNVYVHMIPSNKAYSTI